MQQSEENNPPNSPPVKLYYFKAIQGRIQDSNGSELQATKGLKWSVDPFKHKCKAKGDFFNEYFRNSLNKNPN